LRAAVDNRAGDAERGGARVRIGRFQERENDLRKAAELAGRVALERELGKIAVFNAEQGKTRERSAHIPCEYDHFPITIDFTVFALY
jgi:hypothetical protein